MVILLTKLEETLKYISEYNDFYKNRIKKYNIANPLDITQWPVLSRKELQENRYNMFSQGYKVKYYNQQLHRQSSSGSSGIPINVYWDYKDWYASNLCLWRKRMQWYNIHPNEKYVMFTLNAFNTINDGETVYYIINPFNNILLINISLIQNEIQYNKLINIINEFNPVWFYIQPFILNKLIQTYKKYNFKKPSALRYIESVGEILPFYLKNQAIEFFNVPIANMYGSEEMNGIAYECPNHHMHVLEGNVLIEIKNYNYNILNNGTGETIITNINNKAMPLIRYNQGDIITLDKNNEYCPYSYSCNQIVKIIEGRIYEELVVDKEIKINSYILMELISEINNQFDYIIIEYKFKYYTSKKTILCIIRLNPDYDKWYFNIKKTIIKNFNLKLRNSININVIKSNKEIWDNKKNVFEII